jgi:hypothetical protein
MKNFSRPTVVSWSNARQTFTLWPWNEASSHHQTAKVGEAAAKPAIPQTVQVLAKQIPANISEPYDLGLKMRFDEATTLLAKTEEKKRELASTQLEEHQEKPATSISSEP